MNASLSSSFTTSLSATRTQMDVLMDTSQDFDTDPDAVVRWVASQSPIPALQALMKEAEKEKRTRPSTPILTDQSSWTRSLTSTVSSSSLSTSGSPWHSNSIDSPYLPLSGDSASTSSSSKLNDAKRAKPRAFEQRKPLSASTSSMNQPIRPSARLRSSSHSTSISNPNPVLDTSPEEDTQAAVFIELLRDVSRQLDDNSRKKQRLVARTKEKERERSLGRDANNVRVGLDSSTRPVMKTASASAIGSVVPLGRTLERTSSASGSSSMSSTKSEPRPRVLTKTASLGTPGVNLGLGTSASVSRPSPNLACNLTPEPIPRALSKPSLSTSIHHHHTRRSDIVEPSSEDDEDDDSAMQGVVIDLTETDTEWDAGRNFARPTYADTTMSMEVDDEDNHMTMDVSTHQPKPPQHRFESKPKHLPPPKTTNTVSHPPAPTQRRTGPPPLGMRRVPQLQSSQYSLSQGGSKGVSVPRFKPPLLASAGANKSGSNTKDVNATSTSKRPIRTGCAKWEEEAPQRTGGTRDADSSFDVSFDVDGDALEEALRAYD